MGYLHGHKPLWKGKSEKDVLAEDFFLSDDGMDTGTSSCFFWEIKNMMKIPLRNVIINISQKER
jgi:hypothetical protein